MPKVTPIRVRRAERKRAEILRAGLKVFAEKGFNAATMDDIALELEATKGLLYYHFETKEDLLREILERNELTAGFERILDGIGDRPLREALTVFAERLTTVFEQNRELARFLHVHSLLSGSEAAIIYSEVLARLYGRVAELLEGFRRRGQIRAEIHTLDLARIVASILISDIAQRFIFGSGHDTGPGFLPHALEILLHGIAPRAHGRRPKR
jgi:TetR/AcrR family transcriptional regulator, cholesterol catabolism regulator